MITCCADVLAVSNLFVQGSSAVVKPALTVASIDWTDQDILSVWWVSRVWHPHQHIIGHCGDESLQSVTCAGTDTGTSQNHRETEHKTEQNNSTHSLKWQRWTGQNTPRRTWDKTEPGLVRIYDTKPGNGSGLFCQPWNRHWVNHCDWSMCVCEHQKMQLAQNRCVTVEWPGFEATSSQFQGLRRPVTVLYV